MTTKLVTDDKQATSTHLKPSFLKLEKLDGPRAINQYHGSLEGQPKNAQRKVLERTLNSFLESFTPDFRCDLDSITLGLPIHFFRLDRTDDYSDSDNFGVMDVRLLFFDKTLRFKVIVDDVMADKNEKVDDRELKPRLVRTHVSIKGPSYSLRPYPVLGLKYARILISKLIERHPYEVFVKSRE